MSKIKTAWFNAQRFNKATMTPIAMGIIWMVDRFSGLDFTKDEYALVSALLVGLVVLLVPNREAT